jgi:multisubunit Na+/H+ antiporter MnhE subunit
MSGRPPAELKSAIVTELALLAAATTATPGDLNVDVDAGWRITRSTLMLERIS